MDTFRVLVADDLSSRGVAILRSSTRMQVDVRPGLSPADLAGSIGPYHGLVVRSATKVTADILAAAINLRIIGRAGIGTDNIDIPAASRRGVIVENTPSGNATTAAEHALCMLLSMARMIPQATASMKAGHWDKTRFSGVELTDKTLGLIGVGNIGRIVCDRARGLKMNVVAYDPFIGKEAAERIGAELVTLDELYARADFITIHTPLTVETKNLINAAALSKMKQGVYLVNAARGGIVDEDALLTALERGQVAGAALDVFLREPPDPRSKLIAHERVICTPHLGASTEEAQEKVAIEVAEQLVAFVERGEVENAVNHAAVRAELMPRVSPWIDLAYRLGSFLAQILPRGVAVDAVEIATTGEIGEVAGGPVAMAALAGLLRGFCDVPVNEVNAGILAEERGLKVTEVRRARGVNFGAVVTVRAGGRSVEGTVFRIGEHSEPRIVQIEEWAVDTVADGRLLLVRSADRPGVLGAVGSLMGARGINVTRLTVGSGPRTSAVMVWQVDAELDAAALEAIRAIPNIESAEQVIL